MPDGRDRRGDLPVYRHVLVLRFSECGVCEAPLLPELLDRIPPEQEVANITADDAFGSRRCHDAIAAAWGRGVRAPVRADGVRRLITERSTALGTPATGGRGTGLSGEGGVRPAADLCYGTVEWLSIQRDRYGHLPDFPATGFRHQPLEERRRRDP